MKLCSPLPCLSLLLMMLMTAACGSGHSHVNIVDEKAELSLVLRFPDNDLPSYAARSISPDDSYIPRCIIEVLSPDGKIVMERKIINPDHASSGNCSVSFSLPPDAYSVRAWADYTLRSSPAADLFYITSDLQNVSINAENYRGSDDAKDATFASVSDLRLGEAGLSSNIYLQRPVAKFRLVATDLDRYSSLRTSSPAVYPPVGELSFEIRYEYFLPSTFNTVTGRTTDAMSGITFTSAAGPADGFSPDNAVEICSDILFAENTASFASLSLIVRDSRGSEISRIDGVRVDYRRGYLSTVTGNFLTASSSGSGVDIDVGWTDDFVVGF